MEPRPPPHGSESSTAAGTATMLDDAAPEETRIPRATPRNRRNMTPDKRSSLTVDCRICHEDGAAEELIDPCECSGSLGLIHTSCLEKWLSTSNTDRCEICKYAFTIQRRQRTFSQWWTSRSIHGTQGMAGDVICLIVLTPLCIAATYLCAMGAAAYTRLRFWEGTGLAILCCLLVATYCLWLVVTIRYHFKSYRQWCKRNQDVKLVVKHKTDDTRCREPVVKTLWIADEGQDENNNNSDNSENNDSTSSRIGRYIGYVFASFSGNEDALYTLQHQTTIV